MTRPALLITTLLVLAKAGFTFDCATIFEQAFHECYARYSCGTNVFNLLCRLSDRSIDLSRFDVVFLDGAIRSTGNGPPMRVPFDVAPNRAGASNFRSHFFLVENATGTVYDMDFYRQPVRIDQYARQVLGESQWSQVRARRLGAHQYFGLIHANGAQQGGNRMGPVLNTIRNSHEWPETSVRDILQHFANTGVIPGL